MITYLEVTIAFDWSSTLAHILQGIRRKIKYFKLYYQTVGAGSCLSDRGNLYRLTETEWERAALSCVYTDLPWSKLKVSLGMQPDTPGLHPSLLSFPVSSGQLVGHACHWWGSSGRGRCESPAWPGRQHTSCWSVINSAAPEGERVTPAPACP